MPGTFTPSSQDDDSEAPGLRSSSRTAVLLLGKEAFDHEIDSCFCPNRGTSRLLPDQDWPLELFLEELAKNTAKREASSVLHLGQNLRIRRESTGLLLLQVWSEGQQHYITWGLARHADSQASL